MPGMGTSTQESTTSQRQSPWKPAIPLLKRTLSNINDHFGGYRTTNYEQDALRQIKQNANGLPDFGPQAASAVGGLLGGDPGGVIQNYQNAMNPIMSGNLDPTKTPGMANVLSTIRDDVSNNVNSMFAGAGRDLSGSHVQALSRGISQGEAQPLLNQYNQNVTNAMNAGAGLLGSQQAQALNQQKGFGLSALLPDVTNMGPNSQLAAAAKARGLPLQGLAQLEALMLPIAGLGGQSVGHSESESTASPLSQIMGGAGMFNSLFGRGGMFGY